MRFNEKELKQLAKQSGSVHGTLQHMKPVGGDWSDWYQPPAYKERVFKLVQNFLFYYRPTEPDEPLGVFVLEQMQVAYESPGPAAFAFSLTSNDGKHVFACRCEEDLNKWVAALKVASYTYWKSQQEVLQCKLARLKGTPWNSQYNANPIDPHKSSSQNVKSTFYANTNLVESRNDNNDIAVISRKMSKSTFYSQSSSAEMTSVQKLQQERRIVSSSSKTIQTTSTVPVGNLIDL